MKLIRPAIVLALLTPLFATQLFAAEVQWRPSLEQAEAEVLRSGKPLLLQMTASWCVYCHKMIRETYSDPNVVTYVNANFVPVQLDVDKHPDLTKALRIKSFPSTAIVSADFQTVHKIAGFKKPRPFAEQLAAIAKELPPIAVQQVSMQTASAAATPEQSIAVPEPKPEPPRVAFEGICLVSLLNDRQLRVGEAGIQTRYHGKLLQFASEDHRNLFLAAPEKYWPALEGVCPVTLVATSESREGQPALGIAWQDQIWFFTSEQAQNQFMNAPEDFSRIAARKIADQTER